MDRRVFLIRLLALTTALGGRARGAAPGADEAAVNALREQQTRLDQALKRGDLTAYESLLASDYVATDYMAGGSPAVASGPS